MRKIWELFERRVEYPPMARLLETGPEQGTLYSYVSSTYCNGLLPYLARRRKERDASEGEGKIEKIWLLQRYRGLERIPGLGASEGNPALSDEQISDIVSEMSRWNSSQKLSTFGDDVVLACATPSSWWYFYLDCDVSDCAVGRLDRQEHTLEEIESAVRTTFSGADGTIRAELPPSILGIWPQF